MKFLFAFLLSACLVSSVTAQVMYYTDNSVQVFAGGREQTLAWSGGYDNPQFSTADLNRDGLADLVIFERDRGIKTFINKGSVGNPDYRFAPQYALNFPPCYSYLILADYNCDHIADLFEQGSTGFTVFKGYYNAQNQLCFTYFKELYYSNDAFAGGAANAFNNPGDIPAIVDVDNDGDLDFVSYNILGGYMNLYKNMRVETNMPCDSLPISLKDRCWGKVYQGFYRTHTLASSCNNSGLHKDVHKTTHSGNTPCLFDWDMDGDYDYLDGSVSFNEMTFLKNGRVENGGPDSMISQDTMWQTGGTQIELATWPAAFNIDVDQDGKKDLLIAPNAGGSGSENYKCIWYYQNFSTSGHPDWRFQSDSFMTDKSIDMGSGAYPMLFDYDMDGKPDLFIGSDGYHQASGMLRSKLSLYKNTSSASGAAFTLQTKDFLHLDSFNFKGIAPAFGDIDGDGKVDMVIGHTDGTMSYFTNTAAAGTQPAWVLGQLILKDASGATINVGGNAAPFIYDVDKDGKKDLVIGNFFGTLQYYRNVSTSPGSISLQLVSTNLGHIQVDPRQFSSCYSAPFIGKIDNTGKDYLLMGSNSGNLYLYDGIASGDTTLTYTLVSSQYSYIDSFCNAYNHSGDIYGVYGGLRSAPVVGDIAGDGGFELLIGEIRGGVKLYRRKAHDDTHVPDVEVAGTINVYPNPAANEFNISWNNMVSSALQIEIYDVAGRLVQASNIPSIAGHTQVQAGNLPSGLYIIVVTDNNKKYHAKCTLAH